MAKKRKRQKPSFKQRQTQKARKRNINLKQSEAVRGAVASAISKVRMTRDEQDQEQVDRIRGYSLEIKGTLTEMEDSLKKFTPPPAVAEVANKPGLSMSEAVGDVKKTGSNALFSLLGFMALLGVLISEKARAFLSSFFEGLLVSLGVSKEKIEQFKNIALLVGGLLVATLGVKALADVGKFANSLINLAKVTMGMLIASDTEVDRSMSEARKRKEANDKIRKEARKAKAKARLERIKAKKLSKAKFALRIFGKVGRGLLTAIPFVGSGVAIAFTVWEVAEELNNNYKDTYEDYDLLDREDIDQLKKDGWTDQEIVEHQQQVLQNRGKLAKSLPNAEKIIASGGRSDDDAQLVAAMSGPENFTTPEAVQRQDVEQAQAVTGAAAQAKIRPEEAKYADIKPNQIKLIGPGAEIQQKLQQAERQKEIDSWGSNPARLGLPGLTGFGAQRNRPPIIINNNTNLIVAPQQ